MHNPDLYQHSNAVPRRDTLAALHKYAPRMKWDENERVIDLGCGDGGVTGGVLRAALPPRARLLGADVSARMVRHARAHHGDGRTSFCTLDMGGALPAGLRGQFHHVFSFYAMHWVQDQRRAFSNVLELLRAGGECLLVFNASSAVFDLHRALARLPRWGPLCRDLARYISPYHDMPDQEEEVRRIMLQVGFTNIEVTCERKSYVYELDDFKRTMAAIFPIKIPAGAREEFLVDYVAAARALRLLQPTDGRAQPTVRVGYTLVTAYGTK